MTNNEHNAKVFAEIAKLQGKIDELKSTLKTAELQKNATLAECNALAEKHRKMASKAKPKTKKAD